MFKVYEVTASAGADGRETRHVGIFSDRSLAEQKAKGAGGWGDDGRIRELTVWEPADHTPEAEGARLREAALKKLTPAERRSLGLGE